MPDHPDATIVAGATDVGLWITKQLRNLPKIIHIGRTRGLDNITDEGPHVSIGATAHLCRALKRFSPRIDPDIGEVMRRIGSKQVRASGTIGGNIANGSPIGDSPPMLIALGATLHLRRGSRANAICRSRISSSPMASRTARPANWSGASMFPSSRPMKRSAPSRLTKRFDQDISAVMGAFKFTLEGRKITIRAHRLWRHGGNAEAGAESRSGAARAFRSMRRKAWEQARFRRWRRIISPSATCALRPITGWLRPQALLRKALMEVASGQSTATRLAGLRGEAA